MARLFVTVTVLVALVLASPASAARPSPLALEDEGRASRSLLATIPSLKSAPRPTISPYTRPNYCTPFTYTAPYGVTPGLIMWMSTCTVMAPAMPYGAVLVYGANSAVLGYTKASGGTIFDLVAPGNDLVTGVVNRAYGSSGGISSVYLPPSQTPQTWTIRMGCDNQAQSCSAQAGWMLFPNAAPPPPSPSPSPPPPSPPPPPPQVFRTGTCPKFGSGLGNAGIFGHGFLSNYRNIASCTVNVPPAPDGSVLTYGTTNMAGAQCSGNTYLSVTANKVSSSTDDYGSSKCSYAQVVLPPMPQGQQLSIAQGCNNGVMPCSGTTAWSLTLNMPPPPPSPSPPPPTVYSAQHVLSKTQPFRQRVVGAGQNNPHAVNNGASSTSTETTASGNVNFWEDTTTTLASQVSLGNGHTTAHSTTTDTTATGNPVTNTVVNKHTSTDHLVDVSVKVNVSSTLSPPLCNGAPFLIENQQKNLCLHVKGSATGGSFALAPNVKRPVITLKCVEGSPNQQFSWLPGAASGQLRHDASGLLLSVNLGSDPSVRDGSGVTVLPAGQDATTQSWVWSNPTSGGTLSSAADPAFQLTDALVNAGASIGLPVHMWHMVQSLPSGAPNGAWMAGC